MKTTELEQRQANNIETLLSLPECIMRFKAKVKGSLLFGVEVERLDRESLIAALGWALTKHTEDDSALKKRTDFLMDLIK